MPERIRVEVAYAETGRQFLREIELPAGSTLGEAIVRSAVADEMRIDVATFDVGIWSKPATRDRVLADGDRVELYRPLLIDPKAARRARAKRPR